MNTKRAFLFMLAAGMLLGCGLFASCSSSGKRTETNEPSEPNYSAAVNETIVPAEELHIYTLADIEGIYDSEDGDRYTFSTDGTGTSGRIGSLVFTEFEYTIEGDEIVIKWDEESQSRLKIRENGQAIYDPADDLTYQKETPFED